MAAPQVWKRARVVDVEERSVEEVKALADEWFAHLEISTEEMARVTNVDDKEFGDDNADFNGKWENIIDEGVRLS
jgi:hypothetical protein